MTRLIKTDENGTPYNICGVPQYGTDLPLNSSPNSPTVAEAVGEKADKYEIVTLSFTSSNDGLYVIPTSEIPLSKYPIFAWAETQTQNYIFPINNYRNTNWLMWCKIASTMANEPNKAFTVKVIVV